jgi:hypothetical protein
LIEVTATMKERIAHFTAILLIFGITTNPERNIIKKKKLTLV